MMQIHIDAITASRTGKPQYVLRKSLSMERTSNEERLLELLQSGWDIVGKYINGTGYETYKVMDETSVEILRNFLQKITQFPIPEASIIMLSFQVFYQQHYCQVEDLNAYITFWSSEANYDNLQLKGEEAEKVKNLLKEQLFIKQDKDDLINLLELQQKHRNEEMEYLY